MKLSRAVTVLDALVRKWRSLVVRARHAGRYMKENIIIARFAEPLTHAHGVQNAGKAWANLGRRSNSSKNNSERLGQMARRARLRRVEAAEPVHGYDGRRPVLVEPKNLDKVERARVTAKRNANHCRLCLLEHRGLISHLQLSAGERLQDDHALAGLSSFPSTMAALLAGGGHSGTVSDISNAKMDASRRLEAALRVVGTSGRFLLEQIALHDRSAKEVAVILRKDKQAIVPMLETALDVLVVHYGLQSQARESGVIRALHPYDDTAVRDGHKD